MRTSLILVVAVALLLPMRVRAASDQDACAVESGASDAQFTLALKDGQAVFHEGEIIPLLLSFSTASSRYWLNTASYDRSGRLGIDVYCVDPEGTDPLANYFNRGAFMGGGLFSETRFADKPFTREADLNEWYSLPPGRYRLYAVSHRIFRPAETGETAENGRVSVPLRSNAIEFEVLPAGKQWRLEQVRAAVATLSTSPKQDEAVRAARVLRFLGTRESTKALARALNGNTQQPGHFDLMLGLFSSRYPEVAIQAMHAEFAIPTHAIDGMFLDTLVKLETEPAKFAGENNSAETWRLEQARYKDQMHAEIADLAAVVSGKTGPVRAATLNAMLRQVSDDPSLVQSIRPALIASWKDLPQDTQREMIVYFWQALDTPEMLPVLRSIVAQPSSPALSMPNDMRNAALQHIYEFDAAEGRALIARDLANPSASPSLENIRLLAPEQIQAALPAVADRLSKNSPRSLDYELLDIYGDSSAIGSVQAYLDSQGNTAACGPGPHLLRYLLRVSPEIGAQEVRTLMALRKDAFCYRQLLQGLGDQIPHAQQSAIEALDDPDLEVQQDAVIALTKWGTAEAEEALWARLQHFHDEWAGRAAELRGGPDYQAEGPRGFGFEQALAQGIAWGRGWLGTPDRLDRLATLVLAESDRRQVEGWKNQWKQGGFQIVSHWYPPESPSYSLMAYDTFTEEELRVKVAQFPRGTHFEWLIWPPGHIEPPVAVSLQEEVFQRVRADAATHGVVLEEKIPDP